MLSKSLSLFFLLVYGLFFSTPCQAQTDSSFLYKVTTSIDSIAQYKPAEKVYLHLDNQNYRVDDTIWFKAYIVIGPKHQLSALSKVLYVELINQRDSVLQRQILPVAFGVTWGGMPLTPTYGAGTFRIRAYTRWMQNQGDESFFNTAVQVGGLAAKSNNAVLEKIKPEVQFLPEGGNLISGLRSRIGVKALNADGYGENISGIIVDENGKTVAGFSTTHFGMGVFALTPEEGQRYKARITMSGRPEFSVELPPVQPKGFVLSVSQKEDSLQVIIAANAALLNEKKGRPFYLVAQSGGKVYYTTKGTLKEVRVSASVDKARFPPGIARFTLFSDDGLPVNERIIFIHSADSGKVDIKIPVLKAGFGQKFKIDINTATPKMPSAPGSYSVAVTSDNLSAINELTENTIINNLLLTSELKGNIENPNYYFLNVDSKTAFDLDLLMLTQGYRKFNWNTVVNEAGPPIRFQPEKGLTLEGRVKTKAGLPVANCVINLLATKDNFTADTLTDKNGRFIFNNLPLNDSVKLVLRAKSIKINKDVFISVEKPVYPAVDDYKLVNPENDITPKTLKVLTNNYQQYQALKKLDSVNKAHRLKEVVIKSRKTPRPTIAYSSNLLGPGHADQVILAKDIESRGCINLSDCLSVQMHGVISQGGQFYSVRSLARIHAAPMAIMINGVQVPDDALNNIDPADVYAVEVLRSGSNLAIYGSNASGGAIVITLKKGSAKNEILQNNKVSQGLITTLFKGYEKMRKFYTPGFIYSANAATTKQNTTVYWKPDIVTDASGNATIEFINPLVSGTLRFVIEGVDDNGKLSRGIFYYKIDN